MIDSKWDFGDDYLSSDTIPGERWMLVDQSEGNYMVSSLGRVWSVARRRVLKPDGSAPSGHLRVTMTLQGARVRQSIHRLVVTHFIGPAPDSGLFVLHRDDNPLNNHVDNLRWGTPSENTQDAVLNGGHRNVKKTHCPQGHEYAGDNLTLFRGYLRRCRICSAKWAKHGREQRAKRGLPPNDPRHGTLTGYTSYRCKCGSCRDAMRAYEVERRSRND